MLKITFLSHSINVTVSIKSTYSNRCQTAHSLNWINKFYNKLSYLLLELLEMGMQCIQLLKGRVCMIRMEPTRTDICARLRLRHSHSTKWRWQLSSFSFELQTTKNHWPLGPRRWRSHVPIKTSFKSIRICFLYLYPF
jgi:hypothetical protein